MASQTFKKLFRQIIRQWQQLQVFRQFLSEFCRHFSKVPELKDHRQLLRPFSCRTSTSRTFFAAHRSSGWEGEIQSEIDQEWFKDTCCHFAENASNYSGDSKFGHVLISNKHGWVSKSPVFKSPWRKWLPFFQFSYQNLNFKCFQGSISLTHTQEFSISNIIK